jgi:hypothetical protein
MWRSEVLFSPGVKSVAALLCQDGLAQEHLDCRYPQASIFLFVAVIREAQKSVSNAGRAAWCPGMREFEKR